MGFLKIRRLLGVACVCLASGALGCYDTGDGSAPPLDQFYFPVGLKVSHGGNVLYAANSDFDLQFNGGTLQSYDLRAIRAAVLDEIAHLPPGCPDNPPVFAPTGGRQPLGETCAPPHDSRTFFRDSAVIGAFATDLLLSKPPAELNDRDVVADATGKVPFTETSTDRLFMPVRGNATLTWADVVRDIPGDDNPDLAAFRLQCGQGADRRCDARHQAGEDANEPGNTRNITLPGEPFGAAISEDGKSLVMTHQNEPKTTLFSTGLSRIAPTTDPAIQFVVEQVPVGGVGIAAVPHPRAAFDGTPPHAAFLETSRAIPEITLIRRYPDEVGGVGPSVNRPFLDVEAAFPITVSAGGNDSRGIAIDDTPRLRCKAQGGPEKACARKPARAFIVNRAPPMLLVGEVGREELDGTYDPDRLTLEAGPSLYAGASQVFLAPIVNSAGLFELRAFIVCYDASVVIVYDPDARVVEQIIRVAPGPFAMAFDPFDLEKVATHAPVTPGPNDPAAKRPYRFGYLASFTQSFVQVIDLDNQASPGTYERVVFTLGRPTNPKGT
jgi:hypothetical protein